MHTDKLSKQASKPLTPGGRWLLLHVLRARVVEVFAERHKVEPMLLSQRWTDWRRRLGLPRIHH